MKNARVIAWLLFAIGVDAVVIGLSGFSAEALAKPKMPSLPRAAGTYIKPKMPSLPRVSGTNVTPKLPSVPRASGTSAMPNSLSAIQTLAQLSATQFQVLGNGTFKPEE